MIDWTWLVFLGLLITLMEQSNEHRQRSRVLGTLNRILLKTTAVIVGFMVVNIFLRHGQ